MDHHAGLDVEQPGDDPQVIADALVAALDHPRRTVLTERLERGSVIHSTPQHTAVGNHHAGHAREVRRQGLGDPPADPSVLLRPAGVDKRQHRPRLTTRSRRPLREGLSGVRGAGQDGARRQSTAHAADQTSQPRGERCRVRG